MADIVSQKKRSFIMSRVKSSGNKSTEASLAKIFAELKIKGWRRNTNLPGRPDFIFPVLNVAVFADGCFWHGHKCRNTTPKTNRAYWKKKISANLIRDKRANRVLRSQGWHVFRVRECAITKKKLPAKLIQILKPR